MMLPAPLPPSSLSRSAVDSAAGAVVPAVIVTPGAGVGVLPVSAVLVRPPAAGPVALGEGGLAGPAAVLVAAGAVSVTSGGATAVGCSGVAGSTPPRGACPHTCSNVMSAGAGALLGPPLPHFHPWTSPSWACNRLNPSDEYTHAAPYSRVKNAQ